MTHICHSCGHPTDDPASPHRCCGYCQWHLDKAREHALNREPRDRHPALTEDEAA